MICMQTPHKQKTRYSENPPVEGHVGWVIDSKDHPVSTSALTTTELTVPVTSSSQAAGTRYVSEPEFFFSVAVVSFCVGKPGNVNEFGKGRGMEESWKRH